MTVYELCASVSRSISLLPLSLPTIPVLAVVCLGVEVVGALAAGGLREAGDWVNRKTGTEVEKHRVDAFVHSLKCLFNVADIFEKSAVLLRNPKRLEHADRGPDGMYTLCVKPSGRVDHPRASRILRRHAVTPLGMLGSDNASVSQP